MGLDIYLVVEASEHEDFRDPTGIAFVSPPRHTKLFFAMTGMRGKPCPVPAKGFPEPASSMALDHFGRYIVDNLDEVDVAGCACISRGYAHESIQKGTSHLLPSNEGFVSSPEFLCPSWLSLLEFQKAIGFADVQSADLSLELASVLDLMNSIEKRGRRSRIVFWFDE